VVVLSCIHHHTSPYVSIRQHASAYTAERVVVLTCIRQHTSAYVRIRQHTQQTSADVSRRQHTSG
jgi:hypothetical protein